MKILILSGYAGHTIRTHNVCRLLKNELQIKVTQYVYGKNNYKWLKNQKSSIYDKIFCVEHIYEEIENSWYTEGYGGEIQTRANINIFKTAQINIGIGYRYMQLVSEFYRDPVVPANNYSETESSITINYGLTFNI